MATSKLKIKAKHFVRDLRNGMDDMVLMEKYALSENQLHKAFHKLIEAGAIDEMELFMRTYLSDGFMTRTSVGTQSSVKEMHYRGKTVSSPGLETAADVSITEKETTSGVFGRMLAKLVRTG